MWLKTKDQWIKLLNYLNKLKGEDRVCGLDSEFYGVDFAKKQSCCLNAKIHVWSLAVYADGADAYSPRGYRKAKGCVLPADSILFFKDFLEDETFIKAAHNSNVDVHAFYNHGVDVLGIVNTLSLSRWLRPGRMFQRVGHEIVKRKKPYSLESMATDELGVGKADDYNDMFRFEKMVEKVTVEDLIICRCGALKCKSKGYPHIKDKAITRKITKMVPGTGEDKYDYIPLTDVVEGHELWERFLTYAKMDAVRALELYGKLNQTTTLTEVPWLRL